MITALHAADLHLTAGPERDYALGVLDEIVTLACDEKADLLLFCGDLFDSFADIDILRAEVRSRLERLPPSCKAIYIVGNHERHGAGEKERVANRDIGPVVVVEGSVGILLTHVGIELLCIPHQQSYENYRNWSVPPKRSAVRLALAHGVVCDMGVYTGPENVEADEAGALDPDVFEFHQVDYAALGHIHARIVRKIGSTVCVYAGSARVFRRGESGQHGVEIVRIDGAVRHEFRQLALAGTYLCREFSVGLDGSVKGLEEWAQQWGAADLVEVKLSGVLEDENVLAQRIRSFEQAYSHRVRQLLVNRDALEVLDGIAQHPLARKFVELWEQRRPPQGDGNEAVWLMARRIALCQLHRLAKGRV